LRWKKIVFGKWVFAGPLLNYCRSKYQVFALKLKFIAQIFKEKFGLNSKINCALLFKLNPSLVIKISHALNTIYCLNLEKRCHIEKI
jgi:hypothetical protein